MEQALGIKQRVKQSQSSLKLRVKQLQPSFKMPTPFPRRQIRKLRFREKEREKGDLNKLTVYY